MRFALFCASCGLLLGSARPPSAEAETARPETAAMATLASRGTAAAAIAPAVAPAPAAPTQPRPLPAPPPPPVAPAPEIAAPAATAKAERTRESANARQERSHSRLVRVVVSLPLQRAYVFRGRELVATSPVSTGRRGHETPTGRFPIIQKRVRHYSNLYDNAPMPYMQRLTHSGIALHGGRLPGYPASHGCIRLPHAFARRLYRMTNYSTVVTITRRRPKSSRDALRLI